MLFRAIRAESGQPGVLDPLDRVVIVYLALPLPIFLLGWLRLWAALPLVLCVLYALRPLVGHWSTGNLEFPISRLQLLVACLVGGTWTVFGGTTHWVFANFDWHIRDAVLHDLVASPWPVGYGEFHGGESLLRAPLGYYLPAALAGKLAGLGTAYLALSLWTAVGAALFLLQVLSLTPARVGVAVAVAATIVLFSGFDVIGTFLADTSRFVSSWDITRHLEWWAVRYQYSSMTTQLFWAPNHALGAWLTIGLLCRDSRRSLDATLPMIVVAAALWSPLSALGLVPFVLLKVVRGSSPERLLSLLHPRVWGPAVLVGLVVASYLVLDSSRLPLKLTISGGDAIDVTLDVTRQLQFFMLEAGFIGFAVLALGWSWEVVLALLLLLLLPVLSFGPGNDLVMRASIPSLVVLAIGVCLALTRPTPRAGDSPRKVLLGCMVAVGAVTPITEFARAILLPAWPINLEATLIGAACGQHMAHYTARLNGQFLGKLLRPPRPMPLGPQGPQACRDPARELMKSRGIL